MNSWLYILVLLAASVAHAHGEDKPGPHQGYIKMPGGFHTEVVPYEKGFRIYLLDAEFKSPTTEDSSVKVVLKHKTNSEAGICSAKTTHFECEFTQSDLKSGKLKIVATRKKATGNSVIYSLPLQFERHH